MSLFDIDGLIRHYQTTRGRNWKQILKSDYSLAHMVQAAGLDAVVEAFERHIPYGKGRARMKQEIAQAVGRFQDMQNRLCLAGLYHELKAHFVAA